MMAATGSCGLVPAPTTRRRRSSSVTMPIGSPASERMSRASTPCWAISSAALRIVAVTGQSTASPHHLGHGLLQPQQDRLHVGSQFLPRQQTLLHVGQFAAGSAGRLTLAAPVP